MDARKNAELSMDENYWQAVLSQGEVASSPHPSDTAELWDGFSQSLSEVTPSAESQQDGQRGDANDAWVQAQQFMETGEVLTLEVVGYNRGGLLVSWKGLQGFVPASHLVGFSPHLDEEERRSDLAGRVGTCLKLKAIEIDAAESRFILSERMTTDEEERRAELLAAMEPGEVRQGRVTNLCHFGAFVDLGGVEGLIHISELSWGRIGHPGEVLEVGQAVDVYLLNVYPEEGRIGLSLKRLLPDPWKSVDERYEAGQLVEGVVTNVVNFGAFVRLEEGLEGLIHVSELAEGNFLHPRNVVQEGENVVARVLSIDSRRRRIALSLRRLDEPEPADQVEDEELEVLTASSRTATVY
jgi:small subunit ribosomal protein S1